MFGLLLQGCGDSGSTPPRRTQTPSQTPTPTAFPFPTKTTDCRGVPDSEHRPCVEPCGNGVCFQGLCAGECAPSYTATATRTLPTPTRTAFPTATQIITTYRLTEGSTILSSPAPAGLSAAVLEEPLSGTFTVIMLEPLGGPCANISPCLDVTDFRFESAHFGVTGTMGQIGVFTLGPPDVIFMGLTASINGQRVQLDGGGAFAPNSDYPPTFNPMEICGAPPGPSSGPVARAGIGECAGVRAGAIAGYDLMIFAAPAVL